MEFSPKIGKEEWEPLLQYVFDLHKKSVRELRDPLPYDWEEIGPGYCYGPAFGHWDIVHQILDILPYDVEHARSQILNNLENQQEDGFLPGSIWMRDGEIPWNQKNREERGPKSGPSWNPNTGHPPVWPVAVDAYLQETADEELLPFCYDCLMKQIRWFENERRASPFGFYYSDVLHKDWESGIDAGIRFDNNPKKKQTCVDATCHVYLMYHRASLWAERLGHDRESIGLMSRASDLRDWLQKQLYSDKTGIVP